MSTTQKTSPDLALTVARWRRAGEALETVRRKELRAMTDAEGLAAAEDLLDLLRYLPKKAGESGLVEQQRVFARLRG
ncbi:MAG TPA: hypothetical protein VFB34_06890 [Chloroflexota bacterium]|nr:hypothetical protein [Chloroflexota bacterium]